MSESAHWYDLNPSPPIKDYGDLHGCLRCNPKWAAFIVDSGPFAPLPDYCAECRKDPEIVERERLGREASERFSAMLARVSFDVLKKHYPAKAEPKPVYGEDHED